MTLVLLVASRPAHLFAQIAAEAPSDFSVSYGDPEAIKYQVGAEVTAIRGACRNIKAMVAVPFECAEQQVTVVDEESSSHVDRPLKYRTLQRGARQMLIEIPFLPAGATARAIVTFEVRTRPILRPANTGELRVPKRLDADMRRFINGSPYIEVRHNRIRALADDLLEALPADANDWSRIEAIYDGVLKTVEYVEGPDKSALDALRDGFADCQGRSAVFIAVCRANKIPARMVWVDGHCYPEFYLEHPDGEGSWYPCESAGDRAFGEMPLTRTILQKGDKFRAPERREWLRYASDYLIGTPTPGAGKPKVRYIRQQVF